MLVVCCKVFDVIANEVKQSHCLDCFVAEPVLSIVEGLLAMTERLSVYVTILFSLREFSLSKRCSPLLADREILF
jgi:hypothetical protein